MSGALPVANLFENNEEQDSTVARRHAEVRMDTLVDSLNLPARQSALRIRDHRKLTGSSPVISSRGTDSAASASLVTL